MGLNLRSFGTRTISALFFVVLMLGSLGWSYFSFTVFFLFVALGSLHEFFVMMRHMGLRPFTIAGFASALFLYLLFVDLSWISPLLNQHTLLPLALLLPGVIATASVFRAKNEPVNEAIFTTAGIIYCVLPFALLHLIVLNNNGIGSYSAVRLLGVILLIWSNDTFAYLSGNFFGKNKMVERISPGKTWEGTAGGLLITFALSFIIRNQLIGGTGPLWPILGIVVPVMATIGDLVQSMLKRKAGVKDSGTIMPGHGGLLDRFDSLIFVSPFVVVLFLLLELN